MFKDFDDISEIYSINDKMDDVVGDEKYCYCTELEDYYFLIIIFLIQ